jgi:hypothetical protein
MSSKQTINKNINNKMLNNHNGNTTNEQQVIEPSNINSLEDSDLFENTDLFEIPTNDDYDNDEDDHVDHNYDAGGEGEENSVEEDRAKRPTKRKWFFVVIRDHESMARFRSTSETVVEWPTRQQVFDLIYNRKNNPKLAFFVVALEDENDVDLRHFHILINLKENAKCTISQVLEWFRPIRHKHRHIWVDTTQDSLCLKSQLRACKYVSKKDVDLLYYKVDTRSFHLNWIFINEYCRRVGKRSPIFNTSDLCYINDSFIRNKQHWKNEFRQFKIDTTELVAHRLADARLLFGWHREVVCWYNNFLKLSHNRQFTKRLQLYLWGETNTGKTQFIEWFFRQHVESNQVFIPAENTSNHTTYEQWNPQIHSIVIEELLKINQKSASLLKEAIEQEELKKTVRFKDKVEIRLSVPYVIISNTDPDIWFDHICKLKGEEESRSLRSRLRIIKAIRFENDHKYYRELSKDENELKLNPIRLGNPIDVNENPIRKRPYAYKLNGPERTYNLESEFS